MFFSQKLFITVFSRVAHVVRKTSYYISMYRGCLVALVPLEPDPCILESVARQYSSVSMIHSSRKPDTWWYTITPLTQPGPTLELGTYWRESVSFYPWCQSMQSTCMLGIGCISYICLSQTRMVLVFALALSWHTNIHIWQPILEHNIIDQQKSKILLFSSFKFIKSNRGSKKEQCSSLSWQHWRIRYHQVN